MMQAAADVISSETQYASNYDAAGSALQSTLELAQLRRGLSPEELIGHELSRLTEVSQEDSARMDATVAAAEAAHPQALPPPPPKTEVAQEGSSELMVASQRLPQNSLVSSPPSSLTPPPGRHVPPRLSLQSTGDSEGGMTGILSMLVRSMSSLLTPRSMRDEHPHEHPRRLLLVSDQLPDAQAVVDAALPHIAVVLVEYSNWTPTALLAAVETAAAGELFHSIGILDHGSLRECRLLESLGWHDLASPATTRGASAGPIGAAQTDLEHLFMALVMFLMRPNDGSTGRSHREYRIDLLSCCCSSETPGGFPFVEHLASVTDAHITASVTPSGAGVIAPVSYDYELAVDEGLMTAKDYFAVEHLREWSAAPAMAQPAVAASAAAWAAAAAGTPLPPSVGHRSILSLLVDPTVDVGTDGHGYGHVYGHTFAAGAPPVVGSDARGESEDQLGTEIDIAHTIDLEHLEDLVREQASHSGEADPEDFGLEIDGELTGAELAAMWGDSRADSHTMNELVAMLGEGDQHQFGLGAASHTPPAAPMACIPTPHTAMTAPLPTPLPPAGSGSSGSIGNGGATATSATSGGRNTMGRKEWTVEEDEIILAEVAKHGQKWRVIAQRLPGRSDDAVRNRWKRLSAEAGGSAGADQLADALGLPLTAEEKSVKAAAKAEGKVAAAAAKAAQPKPERLAWTKAEDATIIECVQEFGLKWGRISAQLPGRTAHAIRNRFHRLQTLQAEQTTARSQEGGWLSGIFGGP